MQYQALLVKRLGGQGPFVAEIQLGVHIVLNQRQPVAGQ